MANRRSRTKQRKSQVTSQPIRDAVLCGEALEQLKTLPDEAVDTIITSPPYYRQRDYRDAQQLVVQGVGVPADLAVLPELFAVVRGEVQVVPDDKTRQELKALGYID